MTAREQLHRAYELAFHPARLNTLWNDWERGTLTDATDLRAVLDWALTLHQRLPEAPAVAARALHRLARYQATARLYRLPTMLRRFREKVGATHPVPEEVPAWMVRDIALPVFGRTPPNEDRGTTGPRTTDLRVGVGPSPSPVER